MMESEFRVGDTVRLHDPEEYDNVLEGKLVPALDVPEFGRLMGRGVGPDGKLLPPYLPGPGDEYETLWGLEVTNVNPGDLDFHPYPVQRADLDYLETITAVEDAS
jgi:hypothetical protein